MKKRNRKLAYARVIGELSAEGRITDEKTLKSALRLNPESPIEKAMRAKTDKELQKIGEELEEAQNAFNEGYFEAMPKRKKLTRYERENLKRLLKLKKSGTPDQQRIASTELEVFIAKKISEGVSPDLFKGEK